MSAHWKRIAGSVLAGLVAMSLATVPMSAAAYASVVRFAGADRYATSAAIVDSSYQPGVPVVYIATGLNFPDALAGGAAAAKAGGPMLLVQPDFIPDPIAKELTRLTPASIVVLGGTAAVSNAVLTTLQTYTSGAVTRVSGDDRYATATNLAASFPTGSPVFIATGTTFPDALAGTAAAAAQHAAILLTSTTTLPPNTAAALFALVPSSITILGGDSAVSADVATQLSAYSATVTRISGPDRYATAAAIATKAFPDATSVFITTGNGFADALTGGPVAGAAGQPLLLATTTCLPDATHIVVAGTTPATVTLLGGTSVLGDGVASLTPCTIMPGAVTVSAGSSHSCALTASGGVTCWGDNELGQLGDGTYTQSSVPVGVLGLSSGVVAVAAGGDSTCAVMSVGTVKCWGYSGEGQLGSGTTTDSGVPISVLGLRPGVVAVSVGIEHTCALTSAGSVQCWGSNSDGQLGNGNYTFNPVPLPVDVVGLGSGVVTVSVGLSYSCALTSVGAVECWGDNSQGELGDGTISFGSLVPVGVVGLGSGTVAFSAGRLKGSPGNNSGELVYASVIPGRTV